MVLVACYYCGKGVPQDFVKVEEWLAKRAEQDNASAQCLLGSWYYNGEEVSQDYAKAARQRELFKCYQDWSDENNERTCSERFFGLRLKEIGIEQKRYGDGRYWQNICLWV